MVQWRSLKGIVDYGDNYEVSADGKVRNVNTNKTLNPPKDHKGYFRLLLNLNGKRRAYRVHRLVALAFIPNPENKPEVNHINGDKSDNRIENLEWSTGKENVKHAWEKGLVNMGLGSESRHAKLTDDDVIEIKKSLMNGVSQIELSEQFKVSITAISSIQTGKSWNHLEVDGFTPFFKQKYGEDHNKPKLTENDVIMIKKALIEGDSQYKLAKQFNVSRSVIVSIQKGRTWKEVKVDGFTPFKRNRYGEGNFQSILTPDNVRQIRKLYKTGEYTTRQLGKMFNTSKTTIINIMKGKTWSHVD